jgi:hypothetical protein
VLAFSCFINVSDARQAFSQITNIKMGHHQKEKFERRHTRNNPLRREKWSLWIKRHAEASIPESSKGCEGTALGIVNIPWFIK